MLNSVLDLLIPPLTNHPLFASNDLPAHFDCRPPFAINCVHFVDEVLHKHLQMGGVWDYQVDVAGAQVQG